MYVLFLKQNFTLIILSDILIENFNDNLMKDDFFMYTMM